MAEEGVELLAGVEELAVMGFAEVVSRLPFFLRLRREVFAALAREDVDLVIPIDYPGFNLRLARHAHERGMAVLYFIAPQVWAWHASRAAELARHADRVAVILPFEEAYLKAEGARASFVGHPLLEIPTPPIDADRWYERNRLDPRRPILALFPGSRAQEVRRHLQLFEAAADELLERLPDVQPVIGAAPDLGAAAFAGARFPRATSARELLHLADAALVKSGTTTLEAALAGTPFVVAYRMNPLSWAIARRLVKVPHVALANLVAGERLVPEFLQGEATPANLATALVPLLDNGSEERQAMSEGFARIREQLGMETASTRVAEMAAELLAARR